MDKIIAIIVVIGIALITSIGMLLLKFGALTNRKTENKEKKYKEKSYFRLHQIIMKYAFNKYIIIGAFLYFISSIIFIWVLKSEQLSFIYPLSAVNYFFITFLSIKFLNEKMNKHKWLGMFAIIIGVIIISI